VTLATETGARTAFLTALFSGLESGYVECRALPSRTRRFVTVAQLGQVGDFAQAQRSENVYVGVATRKDTTTGTLENCRQLPALYTDIDFKKLAEAEARSRLERFPFLPSITIASGGGLHVYWLLREPLELPAEEPRARDALRRLALALGADLSVAECAHILRVPDTFNYKYAPPAKVILEECEPKRRYNLGELLEFLPEEERPGVNGHARFTMPPEVGVGDRHLTLFRLGRSLKTKGIGREAILAALREENKRVCVPPLSDDQVIEQVDSVFKQADRPGYQPQPEPVQGPPPTLTDTGNAERFAAQYAGHVRYCYPQKSWYVWTGTHWRQDLGDAIARLAKETAKGIYLEAARAESEERRKAIGQWAARSEDQRRRGAMVDLARSEPGIPIAPEELDRDPWLLNLANGTLNLKTVALQPHRREDFITRLIPIAYDPAAPCPIWDGFIRHVLGGKAAVIRFVQKALGYSLTGETSEQVLFILHGTGSNGKTTLLETTSLLLAPYAAQVAAETLLARETDALAMNDLFTLQGARFVVAIESDMGRRLAESLVKRVTGSDTIKAKKLYTDVFAYRPSWKLFIATNHKPVIRGTDHAIWRRIRLVEFDVVVPDDQQDKALPDKLKAELPGILRWAVDGCRLWQAEGLGPPKEVRQATDEYRADMDVLGGFLAERCWLKDEKAEIGAGELYADYEGWAATAREKPLSMKTFKVALQEHGLKAVHKRTGWVWLGLRLRSDADLDDPTPRPSGDGRGPVTAGDGFSDKSPSRGPRGEVYGETRHEPSQADLPSQSGPPEDVESDGFEETL
jgi:P4 family phage/plasmid primase-like protien